MKLRTRIKSNGDLVTEQTSEEHDGEFRVETSRNKTFVPIKVFGDNFGEGFVDEIHFVSDLATISGTTLIVEVSGTTETNLYAVSSSIDQTIKILSGNITSSFSVVEQQILLLSSSFVTHSLHPTGSFKDSIFQIEDNLDSSKIVKFEVGVVSSSTTRTLTVPNRNITLGNILGPDTTNVNRSIPVWDGTNGQQLTTSSLVISGTNNLDLASGSIKNIGYFDFLQKDSTGIPFQEGRLFYDSEERTLSLYGQTSGSSLQIGQELLLYCVNKTTGTIWNGAAVYISGAQGNRPTIGLAAAGMTSSEVNIIGLATQDIAVNASGYICLQGLLHDVNTQQWPANTRLYLCTRAGEITATPPTGSAAVMFVGVSVVQHQNQGIIACRILTPARIQYQHDVLNGYPTSGSYLRGDGTWWNTSSFDDDVASASFNSRWDDLQGTFDNSTGAQTNLTLTTFDTSGFQTLFFRHDQDNHFSMRFQFPHKWSRTIVKPHLHLLPAAQPTTNVTGTVEIGYQYAWANNSTLTTWSSGSTQM